MMQSIQYALRQVSQRLFDAICERLTSQGELRRELDRLRAQVSTNTPGCPAEHGYKVYSQCDEDGIIANIFSRVGEGTRNFVEIGCSDGLENNTHALLIQGWCGVWIDADKRKVNFARLWTQGNPAVHVLRALITPQNANAIVDEGMRAANIDTLDFLSVDIDGADLYVVERLATALRPRVICVEYNAKFPPPLRVSVAPGSGAWSGDDYQGASLCSFVDVLGAADYVLVACSLSGANAFFVQSADAAKFPIFTAAQLYQPARYELRHLKSGHAASLKFIQHESIKTSPE